MRCSYSTSDSSTIECRKARMTLQYSVYRLSAPVTETLPGAKPLPSSSRRA